VKEEVIEMLILVPGLAAGAHHGASGPSRIRAGRPVVRVAGPGVTSAAAGVPGPGEIPITAAAHRRPEPIHREAPDVWADRDADPTVTALYERHYRALVRLAALLLRDVATAEEIVQDSFAALHRARRRPDNDFALSYLRQSVVHRSRSVLRHRAAGTSAPEPPAGRPYARQRAMTGPEHAAVISVLRALPARQREAIVLRYYADLSEAQTAAAMGISTRAVNSHIARAMTALRTVLDRCEQ
jgi:RNA polymerase sigma-70 factor (sigma-E family)